MADKQLLILNFKRDYNEQKISFEIPLYDRPHNILKRDADVTVHDLWVMKSFILLCCVGRLVECKFFINLIKWKANLRNMVHFTGRQMKETLIG